MAEKKLNFFLMGTTGQGKSATGNTILNRRVLKTSAETTSETKDVSFNFALFGDYTLLVVDGPGLEDTDMDKVTDRTTATQNIDKALAMCYGGVDAFLLVIKFGARFTKEDKENFNALKQILGEGYVEHVIVVMTCGDIFHDIMEENGKPDQSFHEWCREGHDGVFQKLYEDCRGRFVLFNNREKDVEKNRAQVQQVVQLAEDLQKRLGRYTSQCFERAIYERNRLILMLKAPQLNEEFQKKIAFLVAAIEALLARPSEDFTDMLRRRVLDLRVEIKQHDQGYGVLQGLLETLKKVEENLDDVWKLKALGKDLEEIRKAKTTWGVLGTICVCVGGVIALLQPAIGLCVGSGSAVLAGLRYRSLISDEKDIKEQRDQISNKEKP